MAGAEGNAKESFLDASLKDLDNKIKFLCELEDSGHPDEALLLCCCYIEGLAFSIYWPDHSQQYSLAFFKVLKEHGDEEILCHVHPKMLQQALQGMGKRGKRVLARIEPELQNARGELLTEDQTLSLVSSRVPRDDLEWLGRNLWKGTLAVIAYRRMRSQLVHRLHGPGAISFDGTTFKGKPIPPIDFSMLYRCLLRILEVVKERTIQTGKWCGHDFRCA